MGNNTFAFYEMAKEKSISFNEIYLQVKPVIPILKANGIPDKIEDRENIQRLWKIHVETIVFSAIFIESASNYIGLMVMGKDWFYENIERLSPIQKINIVRRILGKNEIARGEGIYGDIFWLIKKRNEIVHHKESPEDDRLNPVKWKSGVDKARKAIDGVLQISHEPYGRKQLISSFV